MATRTVLSFQRNAKLTTLQTIVTAVKSFSALEEPNKSLFKGASDSDHVVVTSETIFHPQGGGQPSDVGSMSSSLAAFAVSAVRMDTVNDGQVLHLGRFQEPSKPFKVGDTVSQAIDVEKRLLYSRLHTAGHVLGAAVRHLLENEIEGFDELKASHFPDSASCEFKGLIDGKWKDAIQGRVDDYVGKKLPVEIDFWYEEDFKREGLERLLPPGKVPEEGWRVVKIVGAEVYPCGGTHVDTTDECGRVGVKKISRTKGVSRVSYNVADS